MKLASIITIAIMSGTMPLLALGSPGTVRHLQSDKKPPVTEPQSLSVKYVKGEKGEPDEFFVSFKVYSCEKGSEACEKLDAEARMVSKDDFSKDLVDDMLIAMKEEKEKDRDGRDLKWCGEPVFCTIDDCFYDIWSCDNTLTPISP